MIVTRFAPSPTGLLHLGHAYAAIAASEAGDRFVVRIEDIDAGRCKPEYETAILEDLTWLGLRFALPVLRQSTRMEAYRAALKCLDERGLLYPCFCTRKDIAEEIARSAQAPHYFESGAAAAPLAPDGPIYPGLCRSLDKNERAHRIAKGEVYALRLDSAKATKETGPLFFEEQGAGPNGETGRIAAQPLLFGDVVLARKETPAAYHLAVVVDDAFQGVTLVTRGNDLFASAHVQRLLQVLLGLPAPVYAHHGLILDANGRKFSKRDHAVTLRALRESGATPEEIHARFTPRR
jgi:glutamyl-Q tRNA(Asp) synthetase